MLLNFTQYFIKSFRPTLNSILTKLFYNGNRCKIGKHFRADAIPKLIVDKNCKLSIGNNVEFRRNVEIRVHGTAEVIIEDNVRLDRGVRILAANNARIIISTKTRIGLYTILSGGDSITIKEKCLISGFVYLQTSMHGYKNKELSIQEQGFSHAPITLEQDVWLGTHVVIMPGCTLGKGSVVGSNAVVTKSIKEYEVVAGIPAKVLKARD